MENIFSICECGEVGESVKFPNDVRRCREIASLTRDQLANCVGVTRQTIGLIESGRVNPGTSIAIAIAKTLGCTVEDLFDTDHRIMARVSTSSDDIHTRGERVIVSSVGGEIVAKSLSDRIVANNPANGVIDGTSQPDGRIPIRLFSRRSKSDHPIIISGCDPGLHLLSQYAGTDALRKQRAIWFPRRNSKSLEEFLAGQAHACAIHIGQTETSRLLQLDFPFPVRLFHLSKAELGWVVKRGNPNRFSTAEELRYGRLRIVNRPYGAGARDVLESQFRMADVDATSVPGYSFIVRTHDDVASAVANGLADIGIAHASTAASYGLTFIPIREETTVLLIAESEPDESMTAPLVECLHSDRFRNDLSTFGTYDTESMGQLIEKETLY